jgi:hypothetical protein
MKVNKPLSHDGVFDVPVFLVFPIFISSSDLPTPKEANKDEGRPALIFICLATPQAAHRQERQNKYIKKPCSPLVYGCA